MSSRHSGHVDVLPIQDPAARKGWVVRTTPQSLYPQAKGPVPVVQEAEWSPKPVLTGTENFTPTRIGSMGRSARSESLYRLHSSRPLCSKNINLNTLDGGTLWRSWLRHWKAAG
jgi:hypothetical protein